MEGAVAPPPRQVTQWRWLAITLVLGFAGALVAVYGFGKGTYSMGPLVVNLSVRPTFSGTTELAVNPVKGLKTGYAEAQTHTGFLTVNATVVDVHGVAAIADAQKFIADPRTMASYVKDQARAAGQKFAQKVGLMALAGGAGGGAIIGLIGLRPRRLIEGAIAGVLLVGLLGFVAYTTYDVEKFKGVTFKSSATSR